MKEPRTARAHVLAFLLAAFAVSAGVVSAHPGKKPARILFPIVGKASFQDDFGDPRGQGGHEGNDILAARRAPVVAVEDGKVRFWTTSANAGCMLYLYGASGTTYYYIHLNNDRGKRNDNRGKCVAGTAYAPGLKDGQTVTAGQHIAYVGDSGDADGLHPHLHFELRPGGGNAVSPYRWLRRGHRLVFAAAPEVASGNTLSVTGRVREVRADGARPELRLRATKTTLSTGATFAIARDVVFALPARKGSAVRNRSGLSKVGSLQPGDVVTVTSTLASPVLRTQIAAPHALVAETIAVDKERPGTR